MINEGAYYHTAKRPFSLIPASSAATFGESNFPSWCAHCADSNRSWLTRGLNLILFEGWTSSHRYGACAAHVFKSFSEIPDEYFFSRRASLSRRAPAEGERDRLAGL